MDKEEIKKLLPHRDPMLLVDKTEMIGDEVISEYTIPDDPFFTRGHFPGAPVVPGVILCEIMAQGSLLLMKDELVGRTPMYGGLDKVRFKHPVHPGDTVVTKAHTSARRGLFIIVEAVATVNGKVCSKGTLSFMLLDKK